MGLFGNSTLNFNFQLFIANKTDICVLTLCPESSLKSFIELVLFCRFLRIFYIDDYVTYTPRFILNSESFLTDTSILMIYIQTLNLSDIRSG